MELIRRSAWGAPATSPAPSLLSAQGVTVHWLGAAWTPGAHSACLSTVAGIRKQHLADKVNGYLDIAYNLIVCPHGRVIEGRGLQRRGGANGNATLNARSYSVLALLGTKGGPGEQLLQGLADARALLRSNGAGAKLWGHSDGISTACPGPQLLAWVRAGGPRPGNSGGGGGGGGGGVHTVVRGDTLFAIAARYGVTVAQLVAANGIKDAGAISIGQRLTIPGRRTYTVRSGDTLSGIATRYAGVTWQQIASANNIRSPYVIHPGDTLTIP
ncbi:LysM peptidoglycan-binding domain-containing protein [Streptomyces carpaticus]|uniref:LysM peptidoglycan-binding domain-containing protein n=1 Tax=Streptomyces carpaticus TaxID=285558 RepID=UPI0031F9BE14